MKYASQSSATSAARAPNTLRGASGTKHGRRAPWPAWSRCRPHPRRRRLCAPHACAMPPSSAARCASSPPSTSPYMAPDGQNIPPRWSGAITNSGGGVGGARCAHGRSLAAARDTGGQRGRGRAEQRCGAREWRAGGGGAGGGGGRGAFQNALGGSEPRLPLLPFRTLPEARGPPAAASSRTPGALSTASGPP